MSNTNKLAKIGHVHLKVSERVHNYIFMTFGKEHHDLALQEIPNAEHPTENMVGLYHFAIELENLKQLAEIYFKLKKKGINISPVNHGISKTIYLSDPDKNGIEIYVDTRDERKKWQGMSRFISEEEFKRDSNSK